MLVSTTYSTQSFICAINLSSKRFVQYPFKWTPSKMQVVKAEWLGDLHLASHIYSEVQFAKSENRILTSL